MEGIYICTKQELQDAIREAVKQQIRELVPEIIREATAKQWLTKKELQELTGWSNRTIQYMRDTRQIPFSQHGYKILYPRKGILEFLESNYIKPKR